MTDQEEVLIEKVIAQVLEVISTCEEIPLQKSDASLHSIEEIARKVNEILVIIDSYSLVTISIICFNFSFRIISYFKIQF